MSDRSVTARIKGFLVEHFPTKIRYTISTDHLDLSANVVPGHDFVQGDSDPRDFNGHGTQVLDRKSVV